MPPPTQRRMLANITQQADSEHNRDLQREHEAGKQGVPVKDRHQTAPAPAPEQPTPNDDEQQQHAANQMSYLQRQYHTAALSESIRSHNEFVQQQKQQQQQQQQQHQPPSRAATSRGPAGRGGANRRAPKDAKKVAQGGGMAPHPNHADVDGYPCPCPDCNLARLQEAMAEGSPHAAGVQPPNHHQHQHQQPDSEVAMLHAVHHEQGYDAGYYGHYHQQGGYQQQQQHQQQGPYRQHSPYAPVSVGYSPNNGYYGLGGVHQSGPNSPAGGGYDGGASFDVPYIPAPRNNYARFAMAPEGTPSDEARSPTDMAPIDPTPTAAAPAQQRKGRQAPPRTTGKKDHAKLSPSSQGEAMPFPTDITPAATGGIATPTVAVAAARDEALSPMKPMGTAKPTRKSSPTQSGGIQQQDGRRASTTAESAEPRPPCPYALKVRCSPWHTRNVISPFAVAVGECVVFEGDRGKDAGIVVEGASNEADSNATGRGGSQTAMALSHGSDADAAAVARADEEARGTVDTASVLVEKLGLRMRVVGAVYQHDRQKLTFMYEASDRVDFRQLLRELYTEFRCRIWLEVPPGAHNPAATRKQGDTNKGNNRSPSPPSTAAVPPPPQQQDG